MKRTGLALLVVAGILGILALLAVVFVTLSRLERRSSLQRMHATRALLLARSGLEDALARLSARQLTSYGGEDWDASGSLNGLEIPAQILQPAVLNAADCPARHALRPSFFARPSPANPDPALLEIDGRKRGFSGVLGGASYALKVEDESAKIHVNGGFLDIQDRDLDSVPDHMDSDVRAAPADPMDRGRGWNFQLARILNVLGNQPEVALPGLGASVLASRPPGGYRSVAQLQAAIGTSKDLSPFLTASGWIDLKVAHPNAWPAQPSTLAMATVKLARTALLLEEGGRPPVNLNAASRPVLQSLLEGLSGTTWQDPFFPVAFSIPAPQAAAIASAVIAQRPFADRAAFEAACDAWVPAVISGHDGSDKGGGNLCAADLLKANFDPNLRSNKELPDRLLWRWIDKTDLTVWSTEGALAPTGAFRISVAARIVSGDGRLLAERQAEATQQVFHLLRHTTQADFVGTRLKAADYLSLSTDPSSPTAGASASAAWWGSAPPGAGAAVQTYPCAPIALPGGASALDGCVGLATLELAPASVPASVRLLHHFDDGWDADLGTPSALIAHASCSKLQTLPTAGTWPAPPLQPATLYPDGGHLQSQRSPTFDAEGNFPPSFTTGDTFPSDHALFAYWAKTTQQRPNTTAELATAGMHVTCSRVSGGDAQFIGTGSAEDIWGLIAETRAVFGDTDAERQAHVTFNPTGTVLLPDLNWMLVTAHFDTDTDIPTRDLRVLVSGLRSGAALQTPLGYSSPYVLALNEKLAVPGQVFVLGAQLDPINVTYLQANVVMDEFALCDFGDDAVTTASKARTWHLLRYKAGRYYRLNDAAFLSDAVLPGQGSLLLSADWTVRLPSEPRQDILSVLGSTPAQGQPRPMDPALAASRAQIELLPVSGGLTTPALRPLSRGAPLALTLPGFRYRARFLPDPLDPLTGAPNPLDQPVLESPWLDDITFAVQPLSGPRTLAWSP